MTHIIMHHYVTPYIEDVHSCSVLGMPWSQALRNINNGLEVRGDMGNDLVVQLKSILMAIYFGADHVVWASQAGIYTNKEVIDRQVIFGCLH